MINRKVTSLVLIGILCFSVLFVFSACNPVRKAAVGTWECNYTSENVFYGTVQMTSTLIFNDGGTGKMQHYDNTTQEWGSTWPFKWEVKGKTIVVEYSHGDFEEWSYDRSSETLTSTDDGKVFRKVK